MPAARPAGGEDPVHRLEAGRHRHHRLGERGVGELVDRRVGEHRLVVAVPRIQVGQASTEARGGRFDGGPAGRIGRRMDLDEAGHGGRGERDLVGEVPVDRQPRHAGPRRDRGQRPVARAAPDLDGSVDDPPAGRLRASARCCMTYRRGIGHNIQGTTCTAIVTRRSDRRPAEQPARLRVRDRTAVVDDVVDAGLAAIDREQRGPSRGLDVDRRRLVRARSPRCPGRTAGRSAGRRPRSAGRSSSAARGR